MSYTVDIPQSAVMAELEALVVNVTGLNANLVFQGLPNRAAMPPASPGFVVTTITAAPPLSTNYDSWDTTSDEDPTTIQSQKSIELRIQIDCYGAASGDWATILQTVLRDQTGCAAFTTGQPLYVDDPLMAPLDDTEEQYEFHWIVILRFEYDPTTSITQDFFDVENVTLINVDEAYKP